MADDADLDLVKPLRALADLAKGPADYFIGLRKNPDPYIAVGAWCALLDRKLISFRPDLWPELLPLCGHNAIKLRAFDFFENVVMEHRLAEQVAAVTSSPASIEASKGMLSELQFDDDAGIAAAAKLYLASGRLIFLNQAWYRAELSMGWRGSLPWMVRRVLLNPVEPGAHGLLLQALDSAGQGDLLEYFSNILTAHHLLPQVAALFDAAAALHHRNPKHCVERLSALNRPQAQPDPGLTPLRGSILELKAQAEEKLGQYEAAYADFVAMNACDVPENIDPEDHYRRTAAKARLNIPPLPPDPRTDVVQMVGFPRSGTTLLENVLGSHPRIETFEEIPALRAGIDMIDFVVTGRAPPPDDPVEIYLKARAKYYEEIDLRRRKPDARVLVDKLPARSSEAAFLKRLFPDWRFIFSIRHPFDVVLSCFKQRFTANPVMENLRSVDKAARVYDHTMSEWFKVHSLDDPAVHYLRYDELVTDFTRTTAAALEFLGLDWDDSVQDFAAGADRRAARTPSYQKVRQGLGIGVQSSWRNYRFAFESEATQPLRKWAEFFGYETA